ncbi:right-handed parallel beta-helix repeat-containing protein [Phragmitibacter flavus]|nr:right-handed parallel beta-helix repeat-containing protein [Phragmitibacter flavus]
MLGLGLVLFCGNGWAGETMNSKGETTKTVRDFGAVGDGVTDDSLAIQRAVDAGIGGVVFPKGVYRLQKTVTVRLEESGFTSLMSDGTAKVVMAGSGPAFLFLGTHEGSADPKQVKEKVWEKERMPMVRGMEIVGDHEEADGIEANGVMQLTVTESRVHRVRHGLRLVRRNRNVIVSNCHFYENRGCGVFFDHVNLHQFNITGSHISYNAGGGIVLRGGEVRNVHIGSCDIESNMKPEGEATANVLIDCREGSTAEVAITGCTIQHNSKSAGSANIRVLGKGVTSTKNALATQEGHITITGNVFSDVMVNVHLDHARGVTIVGNTFWEGFEHDLLVENSQAIVVGPNDFDRNPRYVVNGNWAKDKNGLVFRDCQDSKLSGLLVKGVWGKEAAVLLERCDRFTVTDCSILDSDGIGLLMRDCVRSRVSDCMIRDDREERKAVVSFKATGGKDNWVRGNWFGNGTDVADGVAVMEGNR